MPSAIEQIFVRQILWPLRNPCIVELGAHTGEDESWIREACREEAHYVMVEPDPRNVQKIIDRGPLHRTRRLIIGAIAETNGSREFNFATKISDKSHASGSLRKPTGHLEHFPDVHFDQSSPVECFSLDSIFESEWLTKIDLLWVDIQGAENLMIAGGKTALSHTRYLFMEVENVELYEGEALKTDLVALLPGWTVLQEFEYNVLMVNGGFSERGPR